MFRKWGYIACAALMLLCQGCGKNNMDTASDTMHNRERQGRKGQAVTVPTVSENGGAKGETTEEMRGKRWSTKLSGIAGLQTFSADAADFAIALLRQTCETEQGNVMISPVSVLSALSMTAGGAKGDTQSQMLSVLGRGQDMDSLNRNIKAWRDGLIHTDGADVSLANAIWFPEEKESFTPKAEFLETSSYYFDAEIRQAPFDESVLNEINNWTKEKTKGLIPKILDGVQGDAVMYLINAAAFEGRWRNPYTESSVRQGIFTNRAGEQKEALMMSSTEKIYIEGENAVGFVKPYEAGYSFVALLPAEGMTPEEYINTLDGRRFRSLLAEASQESVHVVLPRFEAEFTVQMQEVLAAMGMEDAFDPGRADFSGMGESGTEGICISRVIHKTYISVDEQGTKAGAATAVEMKRTMAPVPMRDVCLDRPFVYAIVENSTNIPVFIGILNDPA